MIFQQMNFLCPFENMILELSIYNFFLNCLKIWDITTCIGTTPPKTPKVGMVIGRRTPTILATVLAVAQVTP